MKYRNKLLIVTLSIMSFSSCDDQKMEWYKDPTHGEVTSAELPLQLAEKILRYEALNKYTNFILGAGIGLDEYMDNEAYRNIVNENFDEVAIGYAMKHGPMVNAKGELKYERVDALLSKLKEAGLTVYGHTLVWHTNQNASYLNGLIAPEVIPAPAGSNLVDISGLQDGTLNGWGVWNKGDGITVKEGVGLSSKNKGIELKAKSTSSAEYNLQLVSPNMTIVDGHNYQISFWIKSDIPGKGRVSFDGLSNNYPYHDWFATGASASALFNTTSAWQQVKIKVNDFNKPEFHFAIDLGIVPSVTYYIDVESVSVIDLDAKPTVINLLSNGDFESGSISPWTAWSNGKAALSASGEGFGSNYAIALTNSKDGNQWEAQAGYGFDTPLKVGAKYQFSAMVKASLSAPFQIQLQNSTSYAGEGYAEETIGTTWQEFKKEITVSKEGMNRLCLNFGKLTGTYYVDNMQLIEMNSAPVTRAAGATVIEKTDAEKTKIIGEAMEHWISQMVGHYKADVKAWDVVNEPMDDGKPSDLKTGKNKPSEDFASDEFYWQDYLGKDYAVKAFNLARQYGNVDDKLFINDYNLEYNLNKCDGLIEYVKYIESKGAKVDGIGTQMHIAIDSNKDNIAQMFQKLAASGKLIKVTELDIKVKTASPTVGQYAEQAAMYQYVVDMYMKYIPESQRYGITAWGISDNPKEHVNWIPDDAPNLWDGNYARKHAYKGFADGLAGKDVSADFTGDLQD
ncbi:endo-1,4-beta-xylanase [Bacteroides sp.]|uniref:endo-1,4-beta-xylanase n=1 Tax=Bacteroides sp. TaxID=29523 RepID=UPI001B3D43FB|nr:endo-1,4-beta-xylanase [Bacteroides sp.]MBP6064935.1 endo-1,4-beta-xylanase [Bacteroides sp.]MBP6068399.1 endo-1,4-beta-xylanase [Bacteroides sp.]MBP6937052.1 endo-1,4-beta-xylanase [Bacteroides sp.]